MPNSPHTEGYHTPAMIQEVRNLLSLRPGDTFIDATLGNGGHAASLLDMTTPNGELLGLDADPEMLARAKERLHPYANRITLVNDNFSNLSSVAERADFHPVAAVLFDLGLASFHFDNESRGFSYNSLSPLDMRLNPSQNLTAADVVNTYSERELTQTIANYGGEPFARRIATAIVKNRPIDSSLELGRVIESVAPRRGRRLHPATRTFQAIRIQVNNEMENLESALRQAIKLLREGGRLAIIAYHSLEDRIVKLFMRQESRDCICPPERALCVCDHKATMRIITKKVVRPQIQEIHSNRRARSARLRVGEALRGVEI
ncbi:MAG: 16S rRNA (cytosine(1402)-N(4))-methyltransferase [SAR202 cluster bacterium Io17-Chloro-G3]|nr:MAG: 16S rRNA (cytosine(1402)-N(4))-methyltransferase [SAR202 cluster bacterium Io17-Chloro-G3]